MYRKLAKRMKGAKFHKSDTAVLINTFCSSCTGKFVDEVIRCSNLRCSSSISLLFASAFNFISCKQTTHINKHLTKITSTRWGNILTNIRSFILKFQLFMASCLFSSSDVLILPTVGAFST